MLRLELLHYQVLHILYRFLENDTDDSRKASVAILKPVMECIEDTRNNINKIIDKFNTDMSIFVFLVDTDDDISLSDKAILKEFISSKFIST